jgi:uncharacterized protein (TIGR02246 family)
MSTFHKLLIVAAIVAVNVSCQQRESPLTDAQRAAIVNEIKQLTTAAFEAANQLDHERVYSYFSPKTTGAANGKVFESWEAEKQQNRAALASLREAKNVIEEMQVDVLTPNVAVLVGRYHFTATDTAGNAMTTTPAWTWVFARQNGEWRIVHVHVSEPGGWYGSKAK